MKIAMQCNAELSSTSHSTQGDVDAEHLPLTVDGLTSYVHGYSDSNEPKLAFQVLKETPLFQLSMSRVSAPRPITGHCLGKIF